MPTNASRVRRVRVNNQGGYMRKKLIRVLQVDIINGRSRADSCPIAMAVHRIPGLTGVRIGRRTALFTFDFVQGHGTQTRVSVSDLPTRAQAFVNAFDNSEYGLKPFNFYLPIPKEVKLA